MPLLLARPAGVSFSFRFRFLEMRSAKKFTLLLVGLVLCIGAVAFSTQVVEYNPAGVKKGERAKYEAILASHRRKEQLLSEATQSEAPLARFESTSFDFGLVDPHSTLSKEFVVQNVGMSPLTLDVHSTTCKCTVGKLADNILLPGRSTTVTLAWNTGYQAEKYEQKALVATNDPTQPEIELSVFGEVKAVLISPESARMNTANPGEASTGRIVLYSQLWDSFSILEATSDLPGFDWECAPLDTDTAELIKEHPRSAMVLTPTARLKNRGSFSGEINLKVLPADGGEVIERTIKVTGKVRAPIIFISNDIHMTQGLDLETCNSSHEHQFQVLVRAQGASADGRALEVLDVEPKELQATLQPLSRPGNYRLTLTIPKGTPSVMFNRDEKHGYVQVGDPENKDFSNWFPVYGAVVAAE